MMNNDLRYDSGVSRKRSQKSDRDLWDELLREVMSYADFVEQKDRDPTHPDIALLERQFNTWKGVRNSPGVEDQKFRNVRESRLRTYILAQVSQLMKNQTIH